MPGNILAQETRCHRQMPSKIQEPAQRQELSLTKIATVCQLKEDLAGQIMVLICKGIGHFLRTEGKTVVVDLNLTSNEFVMFEGDQVSFVDKKSMRDSIVLNSFDRSSMGPFDRTRKTPGRLQQNTIVKVPNGESPKAVEQDKKSRYVEDDTKSVRSQARSLSI